MKKSGILVLASVLVVGLLAFGAFAMPFGKGNSAVKDALESGDFSSWKEAMTSELTEERFEEMRENILQDLNLFLHLLNCWLSN